MSLHDWAIRSAASASARELKVANEYHRRAELQRRAMMTPKQRAAVDHVLEVESVHAAGERNAKERAFTVVLAGMLAAYGLAASLAGWLALPVLAATIVVTVLVYQARMRVLAAQLDALEAQD